MEASEATPTRRYRMQARAESAAATRRSIANAWLALYEKLNYDDITLDVVAERSSVTVQTVIRHFGSKEELFVAVTRELAAAETLRRAAAPIGDIDGAVRNVIAHYERVGDMVLRTLEQEDRFPAIRDLADTGRLIHYDWVERAFAPFLDSVTGPVRRRRRAQLVALTDVYLWKLLRREAGLGRRPTEIAMTELVTALLNGDT
jgi:AcrR family transcriptional regulator